MAAVNERGSAASVGLRAGAARLRGARSHGLLVAVILVAGFVARFSLVLRSRGGPGGDFGYDPGVYYSSADALIHGRMPYSDYILLHPPALTLLLTPFALLGTLTSDHLGFEVANTVFAALGGVNAALVFLVARRFDVTRWAAVAGATFYALWPGAVHSEFLVRLEPLGNFFLLVGLLCLSHAARAATPRWWVFAGASFGAASATKIWWVVPLAVVVLWTARQRAGRRPALQMVGGAVLGIAVICGPFFVHSPGPMWRMIVTDQFERSSSRSSRAARLEKLMSLRPVFKGTSHLLQFVVVLVVLAVLLALGVAAWQLAALRPVVIVGAAELAVLMETPSYFRYYSDFLAPALALVVAGAAASPGRRRTRQGGRALASAFVVASAVALAAQLVLGSSAVRPFPGPHLAAAVERAHVRCVMADSPQALIELNVLSRTLAAGCPNRVDVTGSTYDIDRSAKNLPRPRNKRWQHDIFRYLTSGNAEITIRPRTGLDHATKHRLRRLPVLARHGHYVVRATP